MLYLIFVFYFNIKTSFLAELTNIVLILDFILIGGVLPYIERKELALMQRRVGPKINGLNGRLQFLLDAIKLFFKHCYNIFVVRKFYFFIFPVIFLYINILFLLNFQVYNNVFYIDIELNIIYFIVFSMMSNILIILTGFFTKNKYTLLASSRAASVFFVNEILLTVVFMQVIYLGESFSFTDYIVSLDYLSIKLPLWILQLPTLLFLFLLEVNKVPFDFLEAESELIMGYTTEYVGFLFGVFVLVEYLHIYIFSYILCILFF